MSIESSPHAKKRLKMRGINEKALYARKVSNFRGGVYEDKILSRFGYT